MHIGQRIRAARKAREITQTKLGNIIGVSQRNISDLESGKTRAKSEMVKKIAEALECDVDDLMAWGPGTLIDPLAPLSQPSTPNYILPVRGTVNLAEFKWPERVATPAEFITVPDILYEGQRMLLRAGDASMEPEIRLGDIMVFDPSLPAVHGSIVCARIHNKRTDACTVRWYLRRGDAVALMPEKNNDPHNQPILLVKQRGRTYRFDGQETRLEVLGVLAGLIRKYSVPN